MIFSVAGRPGHAAGYAGGYSRLTDFIRDWRVQQGGLRTAEAYVPLTFALGEAFQFNGMDAPPVAASTCQSGSATSTT